MAEQRSSLNAAFPAPPPFYQSFTDSNLRKLQEHKAALPDPSTVIDVTALPTELRLLIPPLPPAEGTYRSFGEQRTLELSPPALPDTVNPLNLPITRASLHTLNRSLLLNFLQLVHTLSRDPVGTQYGPKWENLRDLFFAMHQVVNGYRAWEGRERLIQLMEGMVERGRKEMKEVEDLEKEVEGVLGTMGDLEKLDGEDLKGEAEGNGDTVMDGVKGNEEDGVESEEEDMRKIWDIIMEEVPP